jgi:hypothetical protein
MMWIFPFILKLCVRCMLFASLTHCAQSFRPTRKGCIYIFRSCKLIIPVISLTFFLLFIFMMFPAELMGDSAGHSVWTHPLPHLNASSDHLCVSSEKKRNEIMRSDAAPEMKRLLFLSRCSSYGLNSFFFLLFNNQQLCSRSPAESWRYATHKSWVFTIPNGGYPALIVTIRVKAFDLNKR